MCLQFQFVFLFSISNMSKIQLQRRSIHRETNQTNIKLINNSKKIKSTTIHKMLIEGPEMMITPGCVNNKETNMNNMLQSNASFQLSTNPFTTVTANDHLSVVPRHVVNMSIRERVFLILHRPKKLECLYHVSILVPVMVTCFNLNLLKPKTRFDDEYIYYHYDSFHSAMVVMDFLLFSKCVDIN